MVTYDFDGKVAFVTGAAHGQGRSHAEHYARNGADVVVTDICREMDRTPWNQGTREELDQTAELVEEHGQEALALEIDVRNEAEVSAGVTEAIEHFGQIDILANNAGVSNLSNLTKLTEEDWDEVLNTNLKGVWLCAKHVGSHFAERGSGGKIVNTSSVSGQTGVPTGLGHYVASKHGVIGLTKSLALELAEYDVNVNAVCPSAVDTPMITGFNEAYGEEALADAADLAGPWNIFEPGEMVKAEDISEAFMWLSSDAARYVTGVALPVDAGFLTK